MKRKTLIPLSLSFLLAAATAGVTIGLAAANKGNQEAAPSTFVDEVENDNLGAKLAIRKNLAEEGEVNVINAFGYQLVNKTETAYSIRVFGVLDGYKALSSLKVTSKVTSGNEVVKADQTFELDYVYSSIASDIKVTWVNERPATPYYAVYTLNNIPASHAFDDVKVTFTANNDETKKQEFVVNAEGVAGAPEYFDFGVVDEEAATYFATTNSKQPSGKVFVPSFKANYENGYATKVGDIIALGDPANQYASGAAFSGKYSVEEVVIPEGIQKIGAYTFANSSSIKKVNIPSTLTSLGTNVGYDSYTIKELDELDYNATALVNDNASFNWSAKVVKVGANVQSLPNKFFSAKATVSKVIFGGTTAQWKALKNDANKDNGFFIENVICSDTQFATVTLHLGEAHLGDHTGDYVIADGDFIVGNVFGNPGNPILEGMEFKGWKISESSELFYDFATEVEGDLDLYPVFEEPGPGISRANPYVVTSDSASFTASLFPGKRYEYIRYDAPESADAGWVYLSWDEENSVLDKAASSSEITYLSYSYVMINAIENAEGETVIAKAGETSNNAGLLNQNAVQNDQSVDRGIRFFAEPGESYYFKAALYEYSYYPNRVAYGTMGFSFRTYEHDGKSNAISVDLAGTNNVTWTDKYQHVVYKYVAEADGSYVLNFNRNNAWTNLTVVDEANPTTALINKGSTTNDTYGINFEEGHTYYFDVYSNSAYKDTNNVNFVFTSIPDGYDLAHAIEVTTDGTKVDVENVFGNGSYYQFTLAEAGSVNLAVEGASTSYQAHMYVKKSDGTSVKDVKATSSGSYYSSSYASSFNSEIALEAGTYYVAVGYDSTSVSYTGLKFSVKTVEAGSTQASAIAIDVDSLPAVANVSSTEEGKFYKFTATEAKFFSLNFEGVAGAKVQVASKSASGTSYSNCIADRQGEFLLKTVATYEYVIKLYGAEGTGTLTIDEATVTGDTFDDAITFAADESGWMDLTKYASSSSYRNGYIAFTTTDAGTYRIYSTGASNMFFSGLYKSDEGHTQITEFAYKQNRDTAHEITGGSGFYAEVILEANTTYFAKIEIPGGTDVTTAAPFKFGVDRLAPGSTYSSAIEKDFSGASAQVEATADGKWYKFTNGADKVDLGVSATISGDEVVDFYVGTVGATPNASLSASNGNVELALEANAVVYVFAHGAAANVELTLDAQEHIDYFMFSSPTQRPQDSGTDTVCYWYNTHNDTTGTYVCKPYYDSCRYQFTVTVTDKIVSGTMSCHIKVNDASTSTNKMSFSVYKLVAGELTPIEGWFEKGEVEDGRYTFDVAGGDQFVFEYRTHNSWSSSAGDSAWVDSFAMDSSVRN